MHGESIIAHACAALQSYHDVDGEHESVLTASLASPGQPHVTAPPAYQL
jgi:hypothetical protein